MGVMFLFRYDLFPLNVGVEEGCRALGLGRKIWYVFVKAMVRWWGEAVSYGVQSLSPLNHRTGGRMELSIVFTTFRIL